MKSCTCLILGGLAFATILPLTGCSSRPKLSSETAQALYEIAKANDPDDTRSEEFAAMDWSLGTIPKGGVKLPLTSPDGRQAARPKRSAAPKSRHKNARHQRGE